MPSRRILLIAPPRVTLLDLTGPHEVFSRAERNASGSYAITVASSGPSRTTPTKFGLPVICDARLRELQGPFDTVLVAGSDTALESGTRDPLLRWLRAVAPRTRRLGSICTGAFHLARAGLLDGRRATTHWRYLDALAERFPAIRVERDPIYTRDGARCTSAGITAGIDLALALVEEDHGVALAQTVARELVVYLQRPADQAQMSRALAQRMADRDPIRHLQQWVPDHLDEVNGVDDLAAKAALSPRQLARVFRDQVGESPGTWLRKLKLEAANRRLLESSTTTDRIASQTGFGSARSLRRAMKRDRGTTPARLRFRTRERGRR